MAIRVMVKKGDQSVVPIRFCRAVANDPPNQSSDPVRNASDVDDRGFEMGTRPGTWGKSDAHGAMVSIQEGDTVKIKILRTDIDDNAELYVTSTNVNVVRVTTPNNGGPVPTNGADKNIFQIRGVSDQQNTPVKIQVHYGSAAGPVIGELEPHVFQAINLSVAFHLVSILGTAPAKTAADAQTLIDYANDIWRPCGIQFTFNNANFFNETIRQHPANPDRSQYQNRAGAWVNLPHNFVRAGYVTSDERWADEYRESDMIEGINRADVSINIYWSGNSASYDNAGAYTDGDWNGLSIVGGNRRGGLNIVASAGRYDLAHEIGHFLNLNHADENSAGTDTDNKDIWLVRRLLYSQWPANAPVYRNNVGYGADQYGALISVKKLSGTYEKNDGQVTPSRVHARGIV